MKKKRFSSLLLNIFDLFNEEDTINGKRKAKA